MPGRCEGAGLCASVLLLSPGPLRRASPDRGPGRDHDHRPGQGQGRGGPHPLAAQGQRGPGPGHYLEVLVRKPGALAGATALTAARTSGAFTPAHDRYWKAARAALGDAGGTRALVEVLLLHRTMAAADVAAGMAAAEQVGRFDADLVAVEARRHGAPAGPVLVAVPTCAPPAAHAHRPVPSLDAYDELASGVGA